VRSVIAALGTQDFYRIRIGVVAPKQGPLEQFVMERLSDQELEYWSPGGEGSIEKVWEAVVKIIKDECVYFHSNVSPLCLFDTLLTSYSPPALNPFIARFG
jgi:peptidyl-tRNA hydrolase